MTYKSHCNQMLIKRKGLKMIAVLIFVCYLSLTHGNRGINCKNNSTASTLHQLATLLQELASNTDNDQCTNNTIPTNDIERKIDQLHVEVKQLTVKVDQLVNERHTVFSFSITSFLSRNQKLLDKCYI